MEKQNENIFLVFIERTFASIITGITMIISAYSSKTDTSDDETQTIRPQISGDLICEKFFQRFSYPVFLIDLNINPAVAQTTIVNIKAQEFLESNNWNKSNEFFDLITLEKQSCSLNDIIKKTRRKVEQDCYYRDQVRVKKGQVVTAYDVSFFSFESFKESRGFTMNPQSGIRYLAIIMIQNIKDPNEEKQIMDNFKACLLVPYLMNYALLLIQYLIY